MDQHIPWRQRFYNFLAFLIKGRALYWKLGERRLGGTTQEKVVRLKFTPKGPTEGTMDKKMLVELGVRKSKKAHLGGVCKETMDTLESILGEGSTPSDDP